MRDLEDHFLFLVPAWFLKLFQIMLKYYQVTANSLGAILLFLYNLQQY